MAECWAHLLHKPRFCHDFTDLKIQQFDQNHNFFDQKGVSKGTREYLELLQEELLTAQTTTSDLNWRNIFYSNVYLLEYRPYKLVGAFECNGNEIRMYDGNGDNDGTLLEKEAKCSQACHIKKTPIHGSWDGFFARGFILKQSNGRCLCEEADSSTCTQTKGNGWHRYDFGNY